MIEHIRKRPGLAVLALVLVASGCTHNANNTNNTDGSDITFTSQKAITVQNFTITPMVAYSNGNPVTLRLSLKNTGESTAEDVAARLGGPPIDWACQDENPTNSFEDSEGEPCNFVTFGDMKPGDKEANIPAIPKTRSWSLTPPDRGDRTIDYTFDSTVYFKYSTQAQTKLTFMTMSEWRTQGTPERDKPKLENTAAPVKLEIMTTTPIITGRGSNDRMCIRIRNVGGGTTFNPAASAGRDGQVEYDMRPRFRKYVKIRVNDAGGVNFEHVSDGGQVAEVDIPRSRKTARTCYEMNPPELGTGSASRTVPITLNATYGYMKSTSAVMTVKGTPN